MVQCLSPASSSPYLPNTTRVLPICHSIFSELYRKKSRDNVVEHLRKIDATKLSSEQRAIYEQIIRASGHRRGALALWLRKAQLLSHSHAKDLYLPE